MSLRYHPLIEEYFQNKAAFIYEPDDLFVSDAEVIQLSWLICGLDFRKGVAAIECITPSMYNGVTDYLSLDYLLEVLKSRDCL